MTSLRSVLFVTPWYPAPADGVAGVFVADQVRSVAATCDVRVLHIAGWDASLPHRWAIERHCGDDAVPVVAVRARPTAPRATRWPQVAGVAVAARRLLADGWRPDVVHAHVYSTAPYAVAIARMLRVPMVMTTHSSRMASGDQLSRSERWRAKIAFGAADVTTVPSELLGRAARKISPRVRVVNVPNIVDTSVFRPGGARSPEPLVVAVGLLSPWKRFDRAIDALAILRSHGVPCRLVIVGDGDEESDLRRRAAQRGVGDAVEMAGRRTRDEIADLLHSAWILVSTSDVETFGVAVAEAVCSGTWVVSTDSGGPGEIVGAGGGEVVPVDDVDALAAALERGLRLVADGGLDPDVARAAAERYSPEAVGARLGELYDELIERRGARR